MERLSTAFGTGVIQLDVENPDNRPYQLPARTRETVDWEMVNKLSSMSPDFRAFLQRARVDLNGREVRTEWYDKVQGKDDLVRMIVHPVKAATASKSLPKKGNAK